MKLRIISILLVSSQLFQPLTSAAMYADNPYRTSAQLGFIGTSLGMLGSYLGFRYYQSQQPGKKVVDEAKEKLPNDVNGLIGSFLLEDTTLSHDEKLQFLPAILPINKKIVDDTLQKTIDENTKRMTALDRNEEFRALNDAFEELSNKHTGETAIALYAHVLSSRAYHNIREIDLADKQRTTIHQLYIKNETPIHIVLGEPLFPGEIVFVGYSDGSVEIVLSDADYKTLVNLSEKEREMLRAFYSPRIDHGMMTYIKMLNRRQWSEFQQVFSNENKRTCVSQFYNLRVEILPQPDWKKVAIFGAAGIAMYLGATGYMVQFRWRTRLHKKYPEGFESPVCRWSEILPLKPFFRIFNRYWSGSRA